MIKSNFHTHSAFCDGRDSVEDMVLHAIKNNFKYLGFSSHSYIEGDSSWTLKKDKFESYVNEVLRVKDKYKNQIDVFVGIEQDTLSKKYNYNFDYVIGSMHSIIKDGKSYSVDEGLESFKFLLENLYNNNYDNLVKDYYYQFQQLPFKTKVDIIGHFDVITKYVDRLALTLPNNYYEWVEECVVNILKKVKVFELNTGALARGHRNQPYPTKEVLEIIFKNGGQIMINSDCHKKEFLDFGFDYAVEMAKKIGFTKHVIVTNSGLKEVEL